MTKIHSFFKLNNPEKIIILKALLILWIVRIMLWTLPFPIIQKIIKKFSINIQENKSKFSIEKLIWAIQVMSTHIPNATCLTRALAAQILIARYHYPSTVKIGVSKKEEEFEAHAWLESDNKIILGESEVDYTPILNR